MSEAKWWISVRGPPLEMDLLAAETADLLAGDGFDEPDDS
jgi:hypothetical protein